MPTTYSDARDTYNNKKKLTFPAYPTSTAPTGAAARATMSNSRDPAGTQMWNDITAEYTRQGGAAAGISAAPIRQAYEKAYAAAQQNPYLANPSPGGPGGGGGGGGGRGRRRGGGGGGGGALAPDNQAQINYLMQLLGSNQWTAQKPDYSAQFGALDQLTNTVNTAAANDQAAATGAYDKLDQYLGANQTNPYANVQLQPTQQAPSTNAFLASQGGQGVAQPATNNQDSGYGAFQNVLALLGANFGADVASRGAESQMARTFAGQQIGAQDNAYLANIGQQRAALTGAQAAAQLQAQQQLDSERRQILLQLASLVNARSQAPDLSTLGL